MPTPYAKPWLPYADQVQKLRNRGLAVADGSAAEQFLSHVNYYRLSGYCLAFEHAGRHTFTPGTTFDHIRAAYHFDFALRDLLNEALEVIEVDVRTAVAHHFGQVHGAFGHTDAVTFHHRFDHAEWRARLHEEVERSKEQFAAHFRANSSEFPDLPIWVATEVMSFGRLSRMCEGMVKFDQRAVASRYGVQPDILASWSHHLSVVRNHCAHHARVWDRQWDVRPALPPGAAWQLPHVLGNSRVGTTLLILHTLLKKCPATGTFPAEWRDRVNKLLENIPSAPDARARMGMLPGWAAGPLWQ